MFEIIEGLRFMIFRGGFLLIFRGAIFLFFRVSFKVISENQLLLLSRCFRTKWHENLPNHAPWFVSISGFIDSRNFLSLQGSSLRLLIRIAFLPFLFTNVKNSSFEVRESTLYAIFREYSYIESIFIGKIGFFILGCIIQIRFIYYLTH